MQTSKMYYELMDVSDASEAHASINSLSMLRRWGRDEIAKITEKVRHQLFSCAQTWGQDQLYCGQE